MSEDAKIAEKKKRPRGVVECPEGLRAAVAATLTGSWRALDSADRDVLAKMMIEPIPFEARQWLRMQLGVMLAGLMEHAKKKQKMSRDDFPKYAGTPEAKSATPIPLEKKVPREEGLRPSQRAELKREERARQEAERKLRW